MSQDQSAEEIRSRRAPPEDVQLELRDRLRRIESRITEFMKAQGMEFGAMPKWSPSIYGGNVWNVEVPNLRASLVDVLAGAPGDQDADVRVTVVHKGLVVCKLTIHPL